MSTEYPSRTMIPTCADVIERIDSRTDLPLRRRQDLGSAVRRFCRLQSRQPQDVPADPADLRRQLAQMSAVTAALSPGSFRNLKSLLGKALIAAGITTVPRRSRTPLTPEWRQLLAGVVDRHQRYSLSHLARYCSERGVLPTDIDDQTIAVYGRDLILKSLLERPKQAYRNACLAWNKAMNTVAGWPQHKLTIPNSRPTYTLSPSAFPSSFGTDLDAYLEHLSGDDLFGEMGGRPASLDTLKGRRKQILGLASALVEAGHDPQSIRSLADLVAPKAAQAALTTVWNRLGQRKTGYLHNLALLLVILGHHWIKVEPDDLERLRTLRRNLDPGKSAMTENNRRKLLQFTDQANVAALLRLPRQLAAEAVRRDRGGVAEAVEVQSALAIAIELTAPLRINTLVKLNRDQHIVRSRPGPRGVIHLVIPASDVKNRMPLELELPPRVVELLDLYWERFRPRLVSQPGSWLFPGWNGHKNREGMSKQISQTIRKVTGLRMHTHLFRHLAGFLILSRNPGEFETVRLLLGNRSSEMTSAVYCGMEQAAAFRRYDEVISGYLADEELDDAAE
jgi:integrase